MVARCKRLQQREKDQVSVPEMRPLDRVRVGDSTTNPRSSQPMISTGVATIVRVRHPLDSPMCHFPDIAHVPHPIDSQEGFF